MCVVFFFLFYPISEFAFSLSQEETQKLGTVLAFATGVNTVATIGFASHPSIAFLHQDGDAGTTCNLPVANTLTIF